MDKWDEAKRLTINKLCQTARNGQKCGHRGCEEAQAVLKELDEGVFTELARTVLSKRLCRAARYGDNCGHQACIDVKELLDVFST